MSTLIFYMKSGNKIKVKNVKEWKIKSEGDNVTYLFINRGKRDKRGIIVTSICLSQIEAMEEK